MKKLSFAIIGPNTDDTASLERVIIEKGFSVATHGIKSIYFNTDSPGLSDFFDHDIYIFRGYNLSFPFAQSLAKILQRKNKLVIDNALTATCIPTKINESLQFTLEKIPHPKTLYARTVEHWELLLDNLEAPLVIKPEHAQKGQGVQKFNTKSEALSFLRENKVGYLAQEFIPLTYDIRVFIVGEKILGAIKRNVIDGDFRTNASLGSKVEEYKLSHSEKLLALKAHKVLGYDISGVDLIKQDGKTLVLEVNITPQWTAFEEVTKINVAQHIINYILEKNEKD